MMRYGFLRWALRIFSWLAPRSAREAMLGDLAEEFALRAAAASPAAAARWYRRELCASPPPLTLLWTRVARAPWLATMGVALLAYVGVGVAEFLVHLALSHSSPGDA